MEHIQKIVQSKPNHIPETVPDLFLTQENFHLEYIPELDILKTQPQPDPDAIGAYYESDGYISHSDSKSGWFNTLYQEVKKFALGRKAKLAQALLPGKGSVLDLGAGTGDFVSHMTQLGWLAQGVELNDTARAHAREKGVHLHADWDQLEGQQFDVVTLWHVLEHLPNLDQSVQKIAALVKSGGVLLIAVPNYNSYDARFYKKYWAAYDVPRHLWHFSRRSMGIIFKDLLELEKTKPMWFDSFYVSLISEKYKTGNRFSLRGIWVGLWSNVSGLRSKEYSSLIYCYRKV